MSGAICTCTMCDGGYPFEDSDADQPSRFCSADCEMDYYENVDSAYGEDELEDEDGLEEEEEEQEDGDLPED